MPEQMNLLGEPDRPEDLLLGVGQREVMRFLREHETVTRDEAGAIAHERRGKHSRDELCAFCSIDGALLLESLAKRGFVERAADGAVQLPRATAPSLQGDLPEGF